MKTKTIKVSPALFQKWQEAQAEAGAAKRNANQLQKKMGLPIAESKTKGKYVVTNSRGAELGKYTISFRKSFKMPPCYIGRLS